MLKYQGNKLTSKPLGALPGNSNRRVVGRLSCGSRVWRALLAARNDLAHHVCCKFNFAVPNSGHEALTHFNQQYKEAKSGGTDVGSNRWYCS